MWDLRERDDSGVGGALAFALGTVGGLALGVLVSRSFRPGTVADRARAVGSGIADRARSFAERGEEAGLRAGLRSRARDVAQRIRPGRLRRLPLERTELTALEDAVLRRFLDDEVLSERGIDVGCISPGIVELTGTVRSPAESNRAVRAASGVDGVETVVNRLEVGMDDTDERNGRDEEETPGGGEWTGRRSGMGRPRQGRSTDLGRSDDAQHIREVSLEHADRAEFEELGYGQRPRMAARAEETENLTRYAEDELDNQSPYGKHAVPKDGTPALNTAARVGEGLKPGTELALEQSDVPVKPHGARPPRDDAQPD